MGTRIQSTIDLPRHETSAPARPPNEFNRDHRSRRPTRRTIRSLPILLGWVGLICAVTGCHTPPRVGTIEPRRGDEIVAAGQFVHSGTPVVLWMDPGGYDAYRVERRFSPLEKSDWENSQTEVRELTSPNRYNLRRNGLSTNELERVRGGGWDLPTLQRVVDQFVIHFDACGTSRQCFSVLQDHRDLSVHFMLDLDGTIYQTLDLKERAWHATSSNSRSIGIEIANIGAYPTNASTPLAQWYVRQSDGTTRITIPSRYGNGGIRTPGFVGHPARAEPVVGRIQDQDLIQYRLHPPAISRVGEVDCDANTFIPQDCLRLSAGSSRTGDVQKAAGSRSQVIPRRAGPFPYSDRESRPRPRFQLGLRHWRRATVVERGNVRRRQPDQPGPYALPMGLISTHPA